MVKTNPVQKIIIIKLLFFYQRLFIAIYAIIIIYDIDKGTNVSKHILPKKAGHSETGSRDININCMSHLKVPY